jgi:hypothetical protein
MPSRQAAVARRTQRPEPVGIVGYGLPAGHYTFGGPAADLVNCREKAGDHGTHLYRAPAGLGTEPAVVNRGAVDLGARRAR